jgi:hypothetical protein
MKIVKSLLSILVITVLLAPSLTLLTSKMAKKKFKAPTP